MTATERAATPTSFWIVAVLSLIWNAIGANDYLQVHLQNRAYLDRMAQGMGATADQLMAHYAASPWWLDAFWALGVWGSVAGSLLLLLRSRHAMAAFLVSLVGLIVVSVSGFLEPLPGQPNIAFVVIFTAILFAVILGLIAYSRRMIVRRVIV